MVVCSFCLLVPSPSKLTPEFGFLRAREHKSGGFIGDQSNVFCLLFFNLTLTICLSYSCQNPLSRKASNCRLFCVFSEAASEDLYNSLFSGAVENLSADFSQFLPIPSLPRHVSGNALLQQAALLCEVSSS